MKLRYLLLAGGFAFAAALLTQAPAALVYAWTPASRPDAPVRLYGIDGSMFAGTALQISRGPQTLLRQLRWTAKPGALLLGRVAYHVKTDAAPTLLDGTVATGWGGTRFSELKASGELRAVAAMFGQVFVPLSGQVGLQMDHLRIADDWPVQAEGDIRLIGLAWTLGREPVPFGDYRVQITTGAADIVASVSTLAGVVDVSGEGRVKPDRSYELDLKLRPRSDAPAMVTNLLRQLGSPDSQGNYRLRRAGAAPRAAEAATVAAPATGPVKATPPNIDDIPVRDDSARARSRSAPVATAPPSPEQSAAPESEGGYLVVP
ncbi:MAG: type II secretion system protein N [Sinimarinibacterium sp.]|jgi:hypothetical protein